MRPDSCRQYPERPVRAGRTVVRTVSGQLFHGVSGQFCPPLWGTVCPPDASEGVGGGCLGWRGRKGAGINPAPQRQRSTER